MRRAAALAALVALSACDTGTSTEEATVTGVVVRSEALTRGTGCGPKAGQVFKFVAIASRRGLPEVVDAGVYDCFADAAFIDLPPDANGGYDFDISVYAFDKPRYDAQLGAITTALARDAGGRPTSASVEIARLSYLASTKCTARQFASVQSVASCDALR